MSSKGTIPCYHTELDNHCFSWVICNYFRIFINNFSLLVSYCSCYMIFIYWYSSCLDKFSYWCRRYIISGSLWDKIVFSLLDDQLIHAIYTAVEYYPLECNVFACFLQKWNNFATCDGVVCGVVLCGLQAMQDDIACIAALASQSIMALMGVFILFVRLYKDVFNVGISLSKFVGCCPVCQ